MTKDELIELINHTVYENEDGDITGEVMNLVLNAIVATIGVEANPDDEATGTLNKIKIGEEVFDVEGVGGTVDPFPTEGSTNPVQSGGVFEALDTLIPRSSLFGGFITDAATPNPDDSRRYFITLLDGELPNFEIYNLPDNGKWKIIKWNPRDAAWDWETIDSYTSAQIDQLLSAVAAAISGKQDTISDLATIRSGAAAGATAYQKPSGGIPKTDLASGVQTSLGKADTAFQKPSGGIPASDLATAVQTSLGKADTAVQTETDPVFSASPAAGITSGDISYWNGKEEPIEIVDASTPPMTMQPDKVYQYGTLSGDTTFPLLLFINDGKAHIHCWTFTTPATAPTITWPSAITSWAGGSAPTINASKSYEVSVMDGFATIIEN